MVKAIAPIFLLLVSTSAFAIDKSLDEGDWNFGVNAGLGYSETFGASFESSTSLQYFLENRLAVGVEAAFSKDHYRETHRVGTSLTYYFLEADRTIFFISQNLMYNRQMISIAGLDWDRRSASAQTTLGMNYYITPKFAIGPRLSLQVDLDSGRAQLIPSLGFTFSFKNFFVGD